MGSAASVHAEELTPDENTFKAYLSDNSKMEKLFADIASRSTSGNFVNGNSATRINVTNLLSYFNGHPDPLIKKILKNKYVIISAFRYTTQQEAHSQITKLHFHRLMASIFLFSHLWDVISEVDKNHENKRITRDEFEKAKEVCSSMTFLHIGKISDDEWNAKFNRVDADHDGLISFYELCSYICKNVVNIDTFLSDSPVLLEHDDDEESMKYHYMSASAAVAAWEAEEAYRLAREEEMKDRLLTLTGLISNDPIRRSAIHLAVERTELAAKEAIIARTNDNIHDAWKAADKADHNASIASISVEGAVLERRVSGTLAITARSNNTSDHCPQVTKTDPLIEFSDEIEDQKESLEDFQKK